MTVFGVLDLGGQDTVFLRQRHDVLVAVTINVTKRTDEERSNIADTKYIGRTSMGTVSRRTCKNSVAIDARRLPQMITGCPVARAQLGLLSPVAFRAGVYVGRAGSIQGHLR